jgi:N-methylhydantoinase B/oxoprolinase/acetone carboxylase alpha subunit
MDLKSLILGANDCSRTKSVTIPEWPETAGKLSVRELSREEYEAAKPDDDGANCRLAVRILIETESGKRVFADSDAPMLAKKNCMTVTRIMAAWYALQREINAEADAEKKD